MARKSSKLKSPGFVLLISITILFVVARRRGKIRERLEDERNRLRLGLPSVSEPNPSGVGIGGMSTTQETETFYVEIVVKDKGSMKAEIHTSWAPLGASRFQTLVQEGYYNQAPIFRVIKGFIAQFGIAADPKISEKWKEMRIKDDPYVGEYKPQGIVKYMQAFAHSGKHTRTAQVFINFKENSRLDRQGFTPIGKIVDEDIHLLDNIYITGEGQPRGSGPSQQSLYTQGISYINSNFPKIDIIEEIRLIPSS